MTRFAAILLFSIVSVHVAAQDSFFNDALAEFSDSRLFDFEEIPIEWKMEGMLQADLNEGLNFLLEGSPHLAVGALNQVLEKNPNIWQAYYYRAAAQKRLKKYGSAEKDIERALKVRGDFYEAHVELAKILYLRGMPYESERAINKAIRLDRSRGTAYEVKGDINMSQLEMRNAVNNYRDCLKADSLFHAARIKIALIDGLLKGRMDSAIQHLNQVLSMDSLQKTALFFRALLVHAADTVQAVKDLSTLIRVSPYNLMALWFRGLFSSQLGDYEQAFVDFRKVIEGTALSDNAFIGKQTRVDKKIDLQNAGTYTLTRVYDLPDDDGRKIRQAYCHLLLGEYDKCLDVIEQVSNFKKEPLTIFLKAVAYEHKGEHIKALQYYNVTLLLDDKNAEAYKKRGIYEQELKQWDNSIRDFTKYLNIYPNDYVVNHMRGVSYYHMSRFNEAIDDFNLYLKNDSTNTEVIGARGMAYFNMGQCLDAYLDLALSENHHALDFRRIESLVDSVLQLKDTTVALYYLDGITASAPYFTEGFVQKFKIHMARNEWRQVTEQVTHALRNSRADAPKSAHSYLLTLQAMVYATSRHEEDALATLNEAIKYDKENALAYLERGRVLLALGRKSKAEGDLVRASQLGNQEAVELLEGLRR